MLRFGLCCIFYREDIKFRTTTAKFLQKKSIEQRQEYLSTIILHNVKSLKKAILYCLDHHIGCFRITSKFFPLYTHPDIGYTLEQLPDNEEIFSLLQEIKSLIKKQDFRLTLHPDQFVVLNSPNTQVVKNSIRELEYHAYLADLVGADVINIHAGGVYGDKRQALLRLEKNVNKLNHSTREKLTIENDDKNYSPEELLPFCDKQKIPLVYDVHHHRCLSDDLSIKEATELALTTWKKEPLFHISSPKEGWKGKNLKSHADYIHIEDFPIFWKKIQKLTIEIEAKTKELAVIDLIQKLKSQL